MHSDATKQQFLLLRSQGQSFARIGRQLGISKPTLIKWSRQCRSEIAQQILLKQETSISASQELAELNRKLNALRQELLSRALRDVPTEHLETLAGDLRKRIHALNPASP